MSFRNRLVLPAILSALAVLAGCSSSNTIVPPPTGSFTNGSLKGTYVFSAVGSDSSQVFFGLAGTLAADGNGAITGGTLDLNDAGVGVFPALVVSGGSYKVTSDGRGTATLTTSSGNIGLDFVLTSSSHGLVTRYDNNGAGSGTLELQSTVTQSQIAGAYSFSFTGISSFNGTSQPTLATVGTFTLDAAGNVTSGVEDFNSNGNSVGQTDVAINSGSVNLSTVPGVATLNTHAGTFTFDVYPVDATHLKFVETDAAPVLIGDAFTQTSSLPSGTNVFTLAGEDFVLSPPGPFTAAGAFVADGTTAGTEDINDAGTPAEVTSVTGSYSALNGGRSVLTLNNFANGSNGLLSTAQFAAYPSSGGLQLLEIDNQGITAGVAYSQSATTIESAQGYGLNLTGINTNGEEDDIAEFTNTSGTFSGLVDYNDSTPSGIALSSNQKMNATYAADATVSGRGVITSNNSFNLVSYVVDSSTVVFVEVDGTQVGLGSFQLQTPSASSSFAARHLVALRLRPGANKAVKLH